MLVTDGTSVIQDVSPFMHSISTLFRISTHSSCFSVNCIQGRNDPVKKIYMSELLLSPLVRSSVI